MAKSNNIGRALTTEDYKVISAFYNSAIEDGRVLDDEEVLVWMLNSWENRKSELFSILGKELILEKQINPSDNLDIVSSVTLCLSIHPMDFLTMSVNSNMWTTSNNFINGTSRADVMSVMESEFTVVAYVKSPSLVVSFDGKEWNSKLWRQIFHLNEDYLAGAEQFPVICDPISEMAIDWLGELSGKYLPTTHKINPSDSPIGKNLKRDFITSEKISMVRYAPSVIPENAKPIKYMLPSCPFCGDFIPDSDKIACDCHLS